MPGDVSRSTHERRNGYSGVVAQQGRVILDRDVNALQEILRGDLDADALDIVGPCGTPDDGFAIGTLDGGPPFWSPPEPLEFTETSSYDFLISPGTMYLGGRRVEFPASDETITYSYFDQPDWPHPDLPSWLDKPGSQVLEIAYLEVCEQEVSAVEDPDLLEVALGGPDTTGRQRLLRRVKRYKTDYDNCHSAWKQLVGEWSEKGFEFDSKTMRLLPKATLEVTITKDTTASTPCDPVGTAGYLGANNQLIRVQVCESGSAPAVLWGYDDASFIYRVVAPALPAESVYAVQLTTDPPDAFHYPQVGQPVEVLRAAAVVATELDESNPDDPQPIVRCVASAMGDVQILTQAYGPTLSDPNNNYISLPGGLKQEYLDDLNAGEPLFIRVWQNRQDIESGGFPLLDATRAKIGLEVTIASTDNTAIPLGAFWQIAARPSTPQAVYPEELLVTPQPPDGPSCWACPLAVLDWDLGQAVPTIKNCRKHFDNLVELTKRQQGCCTFHVSPEDFSATHTLQDVVDEAIRRGGSPTICLSPGTYLLSQPLSVSSAEGLTIESCGGVAILQPALGSEPAFTDGLVVLDGGSDMTLRGLDISPSTVNLPTTISADLRDGVASIGIRVIQTKNLLIENCDVSMPTVPGTALISFTAGIFLQGDCQGVTIRNSSFEQNQGTIPTNTTAISPAIEQAFVSFLNETLNPNALFSPPGSSQLQFFFGPPQTNVVIAIGCLAMPYLSSSMVVPCTVDDLEISNSAFVGLTFATLLQAAMGAVRIEDNKVKSSVGGFWLLSNGSLPPPVELNTTMLMPLLTTLTIYEFLLAVYIAASYPNLSVVPQAVPAGVGLSGAALFIAGNRIDTIPSGRGSSGLMVYANVVRSASSPEDITASLVATSNYVRASTSEFVPAALFVLGSDATAPTQRSAICNNVVINEAPPPSPSTAGTFSQMATLTRDSGPTDIAVGSDNNLWFTEQGADKIGRITTEGQVTEFPLPAVSPPESRSPWGIALGPDGAMWFTENSGNKIGRITTSGTITEWPTTPTLSNPLGIAVGPDGALWFAETGRDQKIGRIIATGESDPEYMITEYAIPTPDGGPWGITAGPNNDSALWFTEDNAGKIGRITTGGSFTEYALSRNSTPEGIVAGPDGAVWFVENGIPGKIGRITNGGEITEYEIPTTTGEPVNITVGQDGALWFTEQDGSKIGRITPSGIISEYPVEFSPPAEGDLWGITNGPDGAIWFTHTAGYIGRITTSVVPDNYPSLWIIPMNGSSLDTETTLLSVVGNVLLGDSSLPHLTRGDEGAPAMSSWVPLNAYIPNVLETL